MPDQAAPVNPQADNGSTETARSSQTVVPEYIGIREVRRKVSHSLIGIAFLQGPEQPIQNRIR